MPDLNEIFSLDYWREHRLVLLYAAAALVLFVIFTIGTFPYDQALSGALLPMGLKVSYSAERPAFPLGAVFNDVRLVSINRPSPPLMQSDSLKLTPGIDNLIGRPAIGIRSEMYGGRVSIKIRRHADITRLDLDLDKVDFSRYPTAPLLGFTLKGLFSGQADVQSAGPSLNSQKGTFNLQGSSVELLLVKGLPPLRFASLKGVCNLQGQTLRVNNLEGRGPDMAISGSGVIHLGPTVGQTMMEMTLHISPTIAGRTRLGVLFAFLPPHPDGRPYIFHGPLLTPQVS
jgi:type II secretion system protein N